MQKMITHIDMKRRVGKHECVEEVQLQQSRIRTGKPYHVVISVESIYLNTEANTVVYRKYYQVFLAVRIFGFTLDRGCCYILTEPGYYSYISTIDKQAGRNSRSGSGRVVYEKLS